MNRCACVWLALVVVAGGAVPAGAQVTTRSKLIGTEDVACVAVQGRPSIPAEEVCGCALANGTFACQTPAAELSSLVDRGETKDLVDYLGRLAKAAKRSDYVRFVWEDVDADGKPIARSVVYDADKGKLAGATLPGVKNTTAKDADYVDVLLAFVTDAPAAGAALTERNMAHLRALGSLYTSTKQPNPVLEQLPAVVGKLGILEAVAAAGGTSTKVAAIAPATPPAPVTPPQPRAVFRVYMPDLPYKRAAVGIRDWIGALPSKAALDTQAAVLAGRLRERFKRVSVCAASLSDGYARATSTTTACGATTDPSIADPSVCRDTLKANLAAARAAILGSGSCPPDAGSIGIDPVAAVDQAFADLADTLGTVIAKGEARFQNTPRDNVSFGIMTAVRAGTTHFSGTRAKIGGDGKVVEDPLPRLVNAVLINYHPGGYDKTQLLTWKDPGSVKLFGGTTVSPDFGVLGGVAYAPLKGLSFNVGYAVLLINTPKRLVELGSAVPDGLKNDPFKTGRARSVVWGLSYSFQ